MKTCRFSNARLRRWNLGIQDFNLIPEHIARTQNKVADFLSRMYDNEMKECEVEEIVARIDAIQFSLKVMTKLKNLKKQQNVDAYIKQVIDRLEEK